MESRMGELLEYSRFINLKTKSFETKEVDGQDLELLHYAFGIAGEAGELVDAVKKYFFYNQELDIENVEEELGDLLFYIQAMVNVLGLNLLDVIENNKEKLENRYPTGYSDSLAKKRLDKNASSKTKR